MTIPLMDGRYIHRVHYLHIDCGIVMGEEGVPFLLTMSTFAAYLFRSIGGYVIMYVQGEHKRRAMYFLLLFFPVQAKLACAWLRFTAEYRPIHHDRSKLGYKGTLSEGFVALLYAMSPYACCPLFFLAIVSHTHVYEAQRLRLILKVVQTRTTARKGNSGRNWLLSTEKQLPYRRNHVYDMLYSPGLQKISRRESGCSDS